VELLPLEKDAVNGNIMVKYLAMIARGSARKISPANSLPAPSGGRAISAMVN